MSTKVNDLAVGAQPTVPIVPEPSTSTAAAVDPAAPPAASATLEQQVNETIGTLGRFWGGVRKQVC